MEHRHEPTNKLTCVLALEKMLERATLSNDRPRVIIKNCQLNIDKYCANHLVRPNAITQRIRRIRKAKADNGPNAVDIESIEIPEA